MTTATSATVSVIDIFRHLLHMADEVVRINIDGITHAESLIQPQPAGNCANWVMGHLVWVYEYNLPLVGQEPVKGRDALERYARGTSPLSDPADAMDFGELVDAWKEASARMDAGLEDLSAEALDQAAPFSPMDDPDETIRSLLTGTFFHQAYHAGQLALLRRVAGKTGAIR